MPMPREARIEKVQRLLTAHEKTKEMLEKEPLTQELHPGTDIARNWTVITAAYSGLEQTLKYLIAEQKGLTITELIDLAVPENTDKVESNAWRYPFRTHNLGWLFSKIEESTQNIVRDFYERFQSLHSYLAIGRVDHFLNLISGPNGAGYERWRYTLIEDKPLPRNSPEALLAIWGVCVQIAQENVWKNQLVWMPDKELANKFCQQLDMLHMDVALERQNAGEPFQDISGEIRDWLWKGGHPLNAFAEVLWHFARYGSHGTESASEWFSDALTKWVTRVLGSPAASNRTSLRAFVDRAQGHTRDGASIRWNPKKQRFQAIPWSLEKRVQDALPPQATLVGDPTRQGIPLNSLWVAAKDSGYHVLENRASNGPQDHGNWFCSLEIHADDARKTRPVLSIWQEVEDNDHDRFYVVEECPSEEMSQDIRRWIQLARTLGQMRSE